MSYTYASLQTDLLAALVRSQPPFTSVDAFFSTLYPSAIQYAEARIYKDIVMLATRGVNTSLLTTAKMRSVDITSTGMLVPEGFALQIAGGGAYVPYDVTTLDVIDEIWPNQSGVIPLANNDWYPRFWALQDDHTIVQCPTPDIGYVIRLTGLAQPVPLSATNTTTYLSLTYPSLLEAACMVFLSGAINRNYGAQADEPRQAMSWEGIYQQQLVVSKSEEIRRRGLMPDVPLPSPAGARQ